MYLNVNPEPTNKGIVAVLACTVKSNRQQHTSDQSQHFTYVDDNNIMCCASGIGAS